MEGKPEESHNRYIPEEIVHKIFSNLRARSLLRFRCVSKQWQTWISCHNLTMQKIMSARTHWHEQIPRGYNGRLCPFQVIDQKTQVKNISIDDGPGYLRYKGIKMLGSCHDLILLLIDSDLYLWNPSKGRYKGMISIHNLMDPEYHMGWPWQPAWWPAASGLCYDPENAEFKAVLALDSGKVVMIGHKSKTKETIDFPSEITALDYPDKVYYNVRSGPVVNKRLHWFVSNPLDLSKPRILYFNPNSEVKFVDLPLPDGNFHIIGLGVLDGCLCMARRHQNGNYEDHVDVMRMKCYGVQESWTILFRMSYLDRYYVELVPLVYAEKEDVVLMLQDGVIYAFHTKRRTRKVVCYGYHALVYEEDLGKCNEYGRAFSYQDDGSVV